MLKTFGFVLVVAFAVWHLGQAQPDTCRNFIEKRDCSGFPALVVNILDGLYTTVEELHFNPYQSNYYACRLAKTLGYSAAQATNRAFLKAMDLMTPWSGPRQSPNTEDGVALDAAFGYARGVRRFCKWPTATTPFDCYGISGFSGLSTNRLDGVLTSSETDGHDLGEIHYYPILQDSVDFDWTLFANCWNPKTPEHPHRPEIGSWNIFSRKSKIPDEQVAEILARLEEAGFGNVPANYITPNYTLIYSN